MYFALEINLSKVYACWLTSVFCGEHHAVSAMPLIKQSLGYLISVFAYRLLSNSKKCTFYYQSAHELLVLIAYHDAQKPQINANADESGEVRGLNFGLSFHLRPYFAFTSSEGSHESAHMRIHA